MAILEQPNSDNQLMYDLSFMYTKRCDLECPFCMYSSNPRITETLDLNQLHWWLKSVRYPKIASLGAYGGEVGVDLEGWDKIFYQLPIHIPKFVITNGTWSTDPKRTDDFLDFCARWKMHVVVSGTPEHRKHQNRSVLEDLKAEQPETFTLKPKEENFHPMGKLEGKMLGYHCSYKCMWWNRALRICVMPEGDILFQNCDGSYPIVGTICEEFPIIDQRLQEMRVNQGGFLPVCQFAKDWKENINGKYKSKQEIQRILQG